MVWDQSPSLFVQFKLAVTLAMQNMLRGVTRGLAAATAIAVCLGAGVLPRHGQAGEEQKVADPIVLENAWLRITVDAQSGAILSITNRKTDAEYLAKRQDPQPPFIVDAYSANQAIYFRDPFSKEAGGFSLYDPNKAAEEKGDLSHLRAAIPNGVKITPEKTAAFSRVTCAYTLPGGVVATYSITVRPDSALTDWRIQVENKGGEIPAKDQRVYKVAFPAL
jgi:hypothetical protein